MDPDRGANPNLEIQEIIIRAGVLKVGTAAGRGIGAVVLRIVARQAGAAGRVVTNLGNFCLLSLDNSETRILDSDTCSEKPIFNIECYLQTQY